MALVHVRLFQTINVAIPVLVAPHIVCKSLGFRERPAGRLASFSTMLFGSGNSFGSLLLLASSRLRFSVLLWSPIPTTSHRNVLVISLSWLVEKIRPSARLLGLAFHTFQTFGLEIGLHGLQSYFVPCSTSVLANGLSMYLSAESSYQRSPFCDLLEGGKYPTATIYFMVVQDPKCCFLDVSRNWTGLTWKP